MREANHDLDMLLKWAREMAAKEEAEQKEREEVLIRMIRNGMTDDDVPTHRDIA